MNKTIIIAIFAQALVSSAFAAKHWVVGNWGYACGTSTLTCRNGKKISCYATPASFEEFARCEKRSRDSSQENPPGYVKCTVQDRFGYVLSSYRQDCLD